MGREAAARRQLAIHEHDEHRTDPTTAREMTGLHQRGQATSPRVLDFTANA